MPLPRHIGPYRVIQAASHAGAGQVFLCLSSTSQEVAVELLPGVPRERLARQAQALQRLQHPNVIRFVEVGEQPDGTPWLATEWLKVVTLEQRRRRHLASLPAAELVLKLLDALRAVHAADAGIRRAEAHGAAAGESDDAGVLRAVLAGLGKVHAELRLPVVQFLGINQHLADAPGFQIL